MSQTSAEPRRYHVRAIDGRTLCDRYAPSEMTPVREGDDVTVCGACVLAAELYTWQVDAMLRAAPPPDLTPAAAVAVLRRTRWDGDALQEAESFIASGRYEYPTDPSKENQP
jgi:hypothetical protein